MKSSKHLILVLVTILALFGVMYFLYQQQNPELGYLPTQEQKEKEKNDAEKRAFVESYLTTMQAHDYQTLKEDFWDESVEDEIRQVCSSPLGEEGDIEELWERCQDIVGLEFSIIEVRDVNGKTIVWVQFYDQDGSVIGLDLHSEWAAGHPIELVEENGSYRTTTWNFFRS